MIRVTLGALAMTDDLKSIVAYLKTETGMILGVLSSRMVSLNIEIPKHKRDQTVFYPLYEAMKAVGAQVDHFILGVKDEHSRKTEMIFYHDVDITRENPISVKTNTDFAIGYGYFYDLPIYVDDSIKSHFVSEDQVPEDILAVINHPTKILGI